MPLISHSRPVTTFIGWSIVAYGIWHYSLPLVVDRFQHSKDADDRLVRMLARFVESSYQQVLFIVLLGAILYGLWQLIAPNQPAPAEIGVRKKRLRTISNLLAGRKSTDDPVLLRNSISQAQSPLQLLMWAFPMFGFLGTVYGLSGAVGRLSDITSSGQGFKPELLKPVFGQLDIAFDTTIQGILSAMVVAVILSLLDLSIKQLRDTTNAQG